MGGTAATPSTPGSRFAATRWSVVRAAADRGAGTRARRALEELARAYWFPLYAYIRRQGLRPAEAEDLTQDFFARLLEKDFLRAVDQGKGKFRSFLLAALKHFLANEWDKARAQKRGGGRAVLPLAAGEAEARYGREAVEELTPERLYERRWAWAVLEVVLGRLRAEYQGRGQDALFELLKDALTGSAGGYAELGGKVGMSEGAVKVAAHRLRKRYRELLREEISQTVEAPELVEEEIQYLRRCL